MKGGTLIDQGTLDNVVRQQHQTLEAFLPRLLAALKRDGNSDAVVVMTWKSVMSGAMQPEIKTVEHYCAAWIACSAAADILTTLDDGSEAAAWCGALTHRIFAFEDVYKAQHGHLPLSPAGPEEVESLTATLEFRLPMMGHVWARP